MMENLNYNLADSKYVDKNKENYMKEILKNKEELSKLIKEIHGIEIIICDLKIF